MWYAGGSHDAPSHPLSLPGYITGCPLANNTSHLCAKLFLAVFAPAHTFVQHSPLQLCVCAVHHNLFAVSAHAPTFVHHNYFQSLRMRICASQFFAVFAHTHTFVHHNLFAVFAHTFVHHSSLQSLRMCIWAHSYAQGQ